MTLKIVIDMNLSPDWVSELAKHGWTAVHWSAIGDPRAEDSVILDWARANQHAIFTHDLDFGTILAMTHATGPSVLQVRGANVLPEDIGGTVAAALKQYQQMLMDGALIVIELRKSRARVLPL